MAEASHVERPNTALALVRALRPHQWVKNALVFVPLVLGGLLLELPAWRYACLGFLSLCLAASASYIFNDLWDLQSDREHWSKRNRPFASGALSAATGYVLGTALLAAAFLVAAMIGWEETIMVVVYVLASLCYTFFCKRIPIFDIFLIAGLFTFRIALGIMILDVRLSPWLLVFSMFVFLSLSAAKRHTELLRSKVAGDAPIPGRGYVRSDAGFLLALGVAAMLGAVLINIVYLLEDAFPSTVYSNTNWLWVIPPSIFLFLSRVWLISHRGELLDDPVAFALKDPVSLVLGALLGFAFLAAVFGSAMI
ncbi:MAG TPA: UbiA family prenyltransferase [Xanthobacteraceae bacterium]|nr:UbiA family prenyltransferase [Xanthobacteraceae bacterium]